MAGEKGFQERLQGLLGSPTFNTGIGLLAASGPSTQPRSFGQVLAAGTQFASDRQRQAMEAQLVQQQIEEQQRRQAAQQQLMGILAAQRQPTPQPFGLLGAPTAQPMGQMGLLASGRAAEAQKNQAMRDNLVAGRRPSGAQQTRQAVASGQADRRQIFALAAQAAPEQFTNLFIQKMFAQPEQTAIQRDLASAGIDPTSQTGRNIILQSILPEPSKFQQFANALGRAPTQHEVLDFFGSAGTTINIGDSESDKMIPPTQLPNFRLADGSGLPFGTTYGEAQAANARVFSAAQLAKQTKLETALGIVGDLKTLAVGPDGIFQGVPNNALGRAAEGFVNVLGDLAGTKASINRKTYTDLSQGVLAPLVRSLGESGSLATEDVTRGLKLIADIEGVPESEAVAKAKYAALEDILTRGLAGFDTTTNVQPTTGGHFRYNPATGKLEPL